MFFCQTHPIYADMLQTMDVISVYRCPEDFNFVCFWGFCSLIWHLQVDLLGHKDSRGAGFFFPSLLQPQSFPWASISASAKSKQMTLEPQIPLSFGLRCPSALHQTAAMKVISNLALLIFILLIFQAHSWLMKPLTADLVMSRHSSPPGKNSLQLANTHLLQTPLSPTLSLQSLPTRFYRFFPSSVHS